MRIMLVFVAILSATKLQGADFVQALKGLAKHDSVMHLEQEHEAIKQKAALLSSWGDPMLKVAVKNKPVRQFPAKSTPMTGIDLGIYQKIPLSHRRSFAETASNKLAESAAWRKSDQVNLLRLKAWQTVIQWEAISKEHAVLRESLSWLSKQIASAKSLYANGQTSQQAILELQIRHSEVESTLEQLQYTRQSLKEDLSYLFGNSFDIAKTAIPWDMLHSRGNQKNPHAGEAAIAARAEGLASQHQAEESAKTPDITLGASYTFRQNVDRMGDFISVSLQVPLPVSRQRSAKAASARALSAAANIKLKDYKAIRTKRVAQTHIKIDRTLAERKILQDKTLPFADAARKIAAKSYSLGETSYVELLASELSLQKILLKDIRLWADLQTFKAELQYHQGETPWL